MRNALAAIAAIALALLISTAAFDVVTYVGLKQTQHTQAIASYNALKTQKTSAATRIGTIQQRCMLTKIAARGFARLGDRTDTGSLRKSEATCLKQLAVVIRIDKSIVLPVAP